VRDDFVISTGSVGLPVFFPTVEDAEVVVLHVPGVLLESLVNPIGDKGNGLHEDDDERADHPAVKLDCGAPPEGLHHKVVSNAELSKDPHGEHNSPSDEVPVHAEPPGDSPYIPELHGVGAGKNAVNMDTLVLVKVEDHIEGGDASVDNETHVGVVESLVFFHIGDSQSFSISVWVEYHWVVH